MKALDLDEKHESKNLEYREKKSRGGVQWFGVKKNNVVELSGRHVFFKSSTSC